MKTCFAYVRVSTVRQGDGVSLEAQKEAIGHFAAQNEIKISKWFEEKETAAKRGRPVFTDMLRLLKARKADGLVIHKIDRSARNFADWARIGDLSDAGIDIHFATESLDFRSRGGRLTADIQAVIAADYIRNLREETRKGIRGRLKQGLFPFSAPIGYLNQGKGKPKTPDPERAPFVREAFQLYATGEYSLPSLTDEMALRGLRNGGGKPVSRHCIERMLDNPFYHGICLLRDTGEAFQGIHEPLISTALFEQVQLVRSNRTKKKVTKHNHRFRGLFECAICRTSMVPELQKAHVYYRCHTKGCPTPIMREDRLEEAAHSELARLTPSSSSIGKLLAGLEEVRKDNHYVQRVSGFDMQIQRVDERHQRLTDALIDELIDKPDYEARKLALMNERSRLQYARSCVLAGDEVLDRIEEAIRTAGSLATTFTHANQQEQRELLRIAFSNLLVADKKLELEPSEWLSEVSDAVSCTSGDPLRETNRTLRENIERLAKCMSMNDVRLFM
ncbi:recombinase family protein [Minwuia sp.]|uniref:recombinase family protein n=1 Tax=Minwuia sp. TaxID=2493630 RepID=UPI003A90F30D